MRQWAACPERTAGLAAADRERTAAAARRADPAVLAARSHMAAVRTGPVAAEAAALPPAAAIVAGILLLIGAGYLAWKMIDSGNDKLQFFGTILMFLFGWLGVVAALMMWMAKGADIWGSKMDVALKTDTLSA